MEKRLDKIPFVKIRSDDILISGRNDVEHLEHLKSVLSTLKSDGLRLKLRKCVFLQLEVRYLGFRINEDVVLPLSEKVEIIKNAQVPKNTELTPFFRFYKLLSQTLKKFFVFPGIVTLFIKKRNPMEMD